MWRPFDSPKKRRERFIKKNSPYLVPLAVGALAAGADENATGRQRLKRGLVTGGQTFAAMKTAGVFANRKSKENYYKGTILPTIHQAKGLANSGVNVSREIRNIKKNNLLQKAKNIKKNYF